MAVSVFFVGVRVMAVLPSSPFVAGGCLDRDALFVGRERELDTLVSKMNARQAISVNIIGASRIGKSSLLKRFYMTWAERVKEPARYLVIYASLEAAQTRSEASLYSFVIAKLRQHSKCQSHPNLIKKLAEYATDRESFSKLIKFIKQELDLLLVLCLDDFDVLLDNRKTFDNSFYDNLRYLMGHGYLMLIIVSKQSYKKYKQRYGWTSDFFNIQHKVVLKEFDDDTARRALLSQQGESGEAALSIREQALAMEWGAYHPYLLQLAADCLYRARQQGRGEEAAKAEFDQNKNKVKRSFFKNKWLNKSVSLLDKAGSFITRLNTAALFLGFILLLLGVLSWSEFEVVNIPFINSIINSLFAQGN